MQNIDDEVEEILRQYESKTIDVEIPRERNKHDSIDTQ